MFVAWEYMGAYLGGRGHTDMAHLAACVVRIITLDLVQPWLALTEDSITTDSGHGSFGPSRA